MPKIRQAKPKPKTGNLAGLRQVATGFHELQFGKQKPARYMEVPAQHVRDIHILPKGSKQMGNSVWIPVPLKKNDQKAWQKHAGREAMERRKYTR